MNSTRFEFQCVNAEPEEYESIVVMQCVIVDDDEDVIDELPFTLTVEEDNARVFGMLTYRANGERYTHWIEEETQDDFFAHAHMHVRNWIIKHDGVWDEKWF